MSEFRIITVDWETSKEDLLSIRHPVFVDEQNVPDEIEIDEYDPVSVHFLALSSDNDIPIGTARLLPVGKIGRVAVLKEWRKHGVGLALMEEAVNFSRERGDSKITLHAQSWTTGFYEKLGFQLIGAEFEEAGIPHRTMVLALK